ncbi:MAG: FRG domain-containing protein [Clostridia bacterium]|nr:FRG domain-containing protein [Clostridia bacterium]
MEENTRFISNLCDYVRLITNQNQINREKSFNNSEPNDKEYYRYWLQKHPILSNEISDINDHLIKEILSCYPQECFKIYDLLWHLGCDETNKNENQRFYYRGNDRVDYKLAPGIYRKNMKEENYFFREMQVRCSMQLSQNSLLDKLVYLQHYDCPTRLLDITTNPLVALYFACSNNFNDNGIVYCFIVKEKDILYPNSDRAQMLSHLCEFSTSEQQQIMAIAILSSAKNKFPQKKNSTYLNSIIERLYHSIKRETAAFERVMNPFDLLRPAFVQVAKNNPRIIKQDGAFILSGLNINEQDCDNRIKKYVSQKIIIPSHCKNNILHELEQVGICEATLFPEVDKVASFLKKQ